MNIIRGFVCGMLLLLLNQKVTNAQLYDKLVKECYKMNSVFADRGYQNITIRYLFSTEKSPAVYTDSLNAVLKIHQGNYYGKFGSTETMQNKQYLVTIYAANTSIMVSNPVKRNNSIVDIANLDSSFLASNIDSAWITENGQTKSIRFRFTKTSVFKSYAITYDKINYQVQKVVYSLKQQMFNAADTAGLPSSPLISIGFSGYSKAAFSDKIFDESAYVKKDSAGQFKGVGTYNNFEVISNYKEADTSKPSGFLRHPVLTGNELLQTKCLSPFICQYNLKRHSLSYLQKKFAEKKNSNELQNTTVKDKYERAFI